MKPQLLVMLSAFVARPPLPQNLKVFVDYDAEVVRDLVAQLLPSPRDGFTHECYGSASDVVRAGLRLLKEHDAKLKALHDAVIAGEQSGVPAPFDFDAFIARKSTDARAR